MRAIKLYKRPYLIAEIGINHNGSVKLAKEMITIAKSTGFDAVKFQKRDPDICVTENQKKKNERNALGKYKLSFLQKKN